MSISSVFDQDGQLKRPPRLDVFDLFGITCVRDDCSAGGVALLLGRRFLAGFNRRRNGR